MIECKQLSKSYHRKEIFKAANATFRTGKISFVMGPNGAGKTTLIKCLMGLETFEGVVFFDGLQASKAKESCLVLWDDCPFYNNLSGLTNLQIFGEGRCQRKEVVLIAHQYLSNELLRQKVKTYSYGQKKKLGLALIDILSPKYLVMDEISNGLDYDTMRELKARIKKWSIDATVVLTGHQFDFYNNIIDDLFVLRNGQIILQSEDFDASQKRLEDIYDEEIH